MLYRNCYASTSLYDTIKEQRFETTGRGLQSHEYMVAEGFIPIEARSGHCLVSVSDLGFLFQINVIFSFR